MKKVKWIFAVNADGMSPLGYGGIKTGQFIRGHAMKFQKELKIVLSPEIDVEFVGYDIKNPVMLQADLIVYFDNDELYLDDKIKKNGISISYNLYYINDIETIKSCIISNI